MVKGALTRAKTPPDGHLGLTAFPKRIFELSPSETPAPSGQSRAYIELVASLWRREGLRRTTPLPAREAWLQGLHRAVIEAQRLERELLDRLEDQR